MFMANEIDFKQGLLTSPSVVVSQLSTDDDSSQCVDFVHMN